MGRPSAIQDSTPPRKSTVRQFIVLASVFVAHAALADTLHVTTSDGREVLLREDGTWTFADTSSATEEGFGVEVLGERFLLGGSPAEAIAKYSCELNSTVSRKGTKAYYNCKAPSGSFTLAVSEEDMFEEVSFTGRGETKEQLIAAEQVIVASLGEPFRTREEGADCPYYTKRFSYKSDVIEVVTSPGCFGETDPTIGLSVRYRAL